MYTFYDIKLKIISGIPNYYILYKLQSNVQHIWQHNAVCMCVCVCQGNRLIASLFGKNVRFWTTSLCFVGSSQDERSELDSGKYPVIMNWDENVFLFEVNASM